MPITNKQKTEWKEQILRDYPRLKEIENVVDTMLYLYDKDETAFQEQIKKEKKAESKMNKKKHNEEQPTKKPEDFILKGLIERIEAKDVKKIHPFPSSHIEENIPLLGEDGIIKCK